MHETGCSGLVHWDDPEGWDGEEVETVCLKALARRRHDDSVVSRWGDTEGWDEEGGGRGVT